MAVTTFMSYKLTAKTKTTIRLTDWRTVAEFILSEVEWVPTKQLKTYKQSIMLEADLQSSATTDLINEFKQIKNSKESLINQATTN